MGDQASNESTGRPCLLEDVMTVTRISISATMIPGGSWMVRATGWREDQTTAWTQSLGIIHADDVDEKVLNLLQEISEKLRRVSPIVS